MTKKHVIQASNQTLHGSFSHSYNPILTIQSGDTIQYNTVDIGWGYNSKNGSRENYESRENEIAWGHPIVGPIAIKGAKPGSTLEVKINDIVPAWYGWNCAAGKANWQNEQLELVDKDEIKLDWILDTEKMVASTSSKGLPFTVSVRPFMGIMATAPREEGVHSTIPPSYFGGNIDCKELVKGSTLFLPISVEGALFSIGDGHAAQGDGEVSGQAIECPMELVDVTLTVREEMTLSMPRAYTPSGWITFGFHEDLNQASIIALKEMISLIQDLHHVDKSNATALASVVVDLRITQVVNQVKGVHAILPHRSLRN